MTLIVEDGTIVSGAQTYASEAVLIAYAAARAYTLVATPAILLIDAMDFLEGQYFIGRKYSFLQGLQWPRTNVIIDDWWQPVQTIPQLLIDSQCEIAIAIDSGESPYQTLGSKKTKVKAGSVEVDYAPGGISVPLNRKINLKLHKLLVNSGAFAVVKG